MNNQDSKDQPGADAAFAGASGSGWNPITTAPKDGTTVLAHFPTRVGYAARQDIIPIHWSMWGGGTWENSTSGHRFSDEPSHWMELPDIPNDQGEGRAESGPAATQENKQ